MEGETELEVWSALLPVLCGAKGETLKQAAVGTVKLHPGLNYRRLRGIRSAKEIGDASRKDPQLMSDDEKIADFEEKYYPKKTKVRPLSHEEAIALLKYFDPVIIHLRFEGRLSRIEIDRRGKRW